MAEKRVSVRLAVTGARGVRRAFEGVGEAGQRGFRRLSSEMERANRRVARFARGADTALKVAAAGVTAALAQIARSTIRAAKEIDRLAALGNAPVEQFQRFAAGARSVNIEQAKLADILKDVNDKVGDFLATGGGPLRDFFENVAPRVGVTADQFARLSGPEALQLYVSTLEKAGLSQQQMTFYMEALANDATRLLPLLRDNGAEMERLGDRAARLGGVMDRETIDSLRRSGAAITEMSETMAGLRRRIGAAMAPALEAMADAFSALAREGGPLARAIGAVLDNIGRLASAAAAFAAFMAGRWVARLAAAALSVRGVATALVALRAALVRTGIGALIVGAGELIYQFGRLVKGAGGFGRAMELLGDVASEVWERIKMGARSLSSLLESVWVTVQAGWLRVMKAIQRRWADFLHEVARGLDGLPGMDGLFERVAGAAVRAGSGVYSLEAAIEAAQERAAALAEQSAATARAATEPLESVEALSRAVAKAGADGEEALGDAEEAAQRYRAALEAAGDAAGRAGGGGASRLAPAASPLPVARGGADPAPGARDAPGAADAGWRRASDALAAYAKRADDSAARIREALVGAFRGAERALGDFVRTGKLNMRDLVSSVLSDFARLSAQRFILGPLAQALSGAAGGLLGGGAAFPQTLAGAQPGTFSYAGGGYTGDGARAGGLDGRGGFLAMLHPRERVIDETRGRAAERPVVVNVHVRDAESVRRSRVQIASDVQRAVSMGRRGL